MHFLVSIKVHFLRHCLQKIIFRSQGIRKKALRLSREFEVISKKKTPFPRMIMALYREIVRSNATRSSRALSNHPYAPIPPARYPILHTLYPTRNGSILQYRSARYPIIPYPPPYPISPSQRDSILFRDILYVCICYNE